MEDGIALVVITVFVLVNETGERRNSAVKDVENFAILSDKLSEDMVGVPVMPQDNPQTTLLYAIQVILKIPKTHLFLL